MVMIENASIAWANMKKYLFVIFLIFFCDANKLFAVEQWYHYCNQRFGQCVDVPVNLKKAPSSENGDGQTFLSNDGLKVSIWASWNINNYDAKETLKAFGDQEGTVTYQIVKNNWYVQSGIYGDEIFYEKHIVNKNVVSGLRVEYPSIKKSEYDAIVTRIARSFAAAPDNQ